MCKSIIQLMDELKAALDEYDRLTRLDDPRIAEQDRLSSLPDPPDDTGEPWRKP